MTITPHTELLTRHPANPIITAADLPYPANSVFNPAATIRDGETTLLMRVEDRRGLSHLTVARSPDGVAGWRIDAAPTFVGKPDTHPEEIWGIEDP
ncbi:MAG: glycosidase, partial [Armatimonadota bacterium]